MEPTDNSANTRGRHGRGRGGRGMRRGVRTRGGKRGGGRPERPSVSEPLFSSTVENLPAGQPMEKALHPKRVRVPVPEATTSRSETLWSSFDTIAPMTSTTSREEETPSPMPSVSSPTLHVECAASSGSSTPTTKRTVNPGVGDSGEKRRRSLFPSSSTVRPLSDCDSILNYGSEEESDEDEEEVLVHPIFVPRVARIFMDFKDEEVEEHSVSISLEWPPQLPHPCPTPTPATPTPVQPAQKFLFDWRGFPMPQNEPHLRREPFSQINTGPTVSFTTPYKAFTAIWDREIMEVIVTETNNYAQQLATIKLQTGAIHPHSRITRWQDTNVNELYTYLAIVLAMGVVVKSRIEEYWNISRDIFSTPGFSTEMSFDRFQLLSRCLHFNNNDSFDVALLTRPQAKLFKIQPILDHLNCKFSQLYNLSQNLALDESLTMWKGCLDINQFIRNKAATVGIKTYEVCESQTGYLWRFEVHAGHDTSAQRDDDPVSGLIPALVLRLLNGLEHKGHTIWMDNFYNSPALARELKVLGFDCVGTLQTNRQFVPSELASITKKDMSVGQVLGCTSGDVDLMVWRDKNLVAFVSTYHGLASTSCKNILKPTVVHDYNICMGGVDRKDQQLAMYPIERKRTRVWYKKFFRRLLNVSVLNSHILLNQSLSHRKFRKVLITDLLTIHKKPAPTPTITPSTSRVHCPALYDMMKSPHRLKRQCAVCKKRTSSYCKACNVAMCTYICFEPYHTSQ